MGIKRCQSWDKNRIKCEGEHRHSGPHFWKQGSTFFYFSAEGADATLSPPEVMPDVTSVSIEEAIRCTNTNDIGQRCLKSTHSNSEKCDFPDVKIPERFQGHKMDKLAAFNAIAEILVSLDKNEKEKVLQSICVLYEVDL